MAASSPIRIEIVELVEGKEKITGQPFMIEIKVYSPAIAHKHILSKKTKIHWGKAQHAGVLPINEIFTLDSHTVVNPSMYAHLTLYKAQATNFVLDEVKVGMSSLCEVDDMETKISANFEKGSASIVLKMIRGNPPPTKAQSTTPTGTLTPSAASHAVGTIHGNPPAPQPVYDPQQVAMAAYQMERSHLLSTPGIFKFKIFRGNDTEMVSKAAADWMNSMADILQVISISAVQRGSLDTVIWFRVMHPQPGPMMPANPLPQIQPPYQPQQPQVSSSQSQPTRPRSEVAPAHSPQPQWTGPTPYSGVPPSYQTTVQTDPVVSLADTLNAQTLSKTDDIDK